MRRFVFLLVGDNMAAESIFQKALDLGSENIAHNQTSDGKPFSLYRNVLKAMAAHDGYQDTAQAESHSSLTMHEKSSQASALLQEFQGLPLQYKAAMALVVIERWSIRDAAAAMDQTEDQLRQDLLEARRRFNPTFWHCF